MHRGSVRAVKVTALELPARWNAPAAAFAQVDALLTSGGPTDLVLLPEAAITGYLSANGDCDLSPFAETLNESPTCGALAALAIKHRTHLIGPLVERAPDGQCFNSMVGFDPRGARVLHYRKRHPWFPERWATAGAEPLPVLEIDGHSFTIAICFDLHFVAEESAAALHQADTLLFASAWVDETSNERWPLLEGLARDFQLNIVNANWGIGRPRLLGQGKSVVLDAGGLHLAEGGPRLDAVIETP